jgi:hypothetical protein
VYRSGAVRFLEARPPFASCQARQQKARQVNWRALLFEEALASAGHRLQRHRADRLAVERKFTAWVDTDLNGLAR